LLFGPMDVFTAGRMAMLQDRQGAAFAVWQPQDHIGVRVKGEPGAIMWNELLTSDPEDAIDFYRGMLGVDSAAMDGPMEYTMLKAAGTDVAGVMRITEEMGPVPPNWMVYFGVANVDDSCEKAVSLGAVLLMPGTDIPGIGRFATIKDPQGAVFSIFAGA
jgi:predicted enzyme related to lactoylglutathione lyase